MTTPIVVVGAGGFGRETVDVVAAINGVKATFDLLGVVDSDPSEVNLRRLEDRGVSYLGREEDWLASYASGVAFVVAVGNPQVRSRIVERWLPSGHSPVSLVHPSVGVGGTSTVGRGSVVCAGVQISTNVTIGDFVHLNPNSTVGHDSTLHECVSLNPGGVISGDVTVGARSLVGAGAVILQGLTVGRDAIVGASSCVTKNVRDGSTVKGVPAR